MQFGGSFTFREDYRTYAYFLFLNVKYELYITQLDYKLTSGRHKINNKRLFYLFFVVVIMLLSLLND